MILFDGETGPLDEAEALAKAEPFDPDKAVPPLGPFDPDSVKCGGLTEAKAAEKIAKARESHELAKANREDLIEVARSRHTAKVMSEAALHAHTGQVLTIGIVTPDGQIVIVEDKSEREILKFFWDLYTHSHYDHKFVGFNTHGFDLPFFVKRSWYLSVSVPDDVYDFRGYFHSSLVDLMKVWSLGKQSYITLDRLCELLGVGRKTEGINGGDFARLWNGTRAERRQAIEYLENDLQLTAAVAKRMGIK